MTAKNPDERYSDPAEVAAALAPFAQGNRAGESGAGDVGRDVWLDARHGEVGHDDRQESADSDTLARSSPSRSRLPTMSAAGAR